MSEYLQAFTEGEEQKETVNPATALREQREAQETVSRNEFIEEFNGKLEDGKADKGEQ